MRITLLVLSSLVGLSLTACNDDGESDPAPRSSDEDAGADSTGDSPGDTDKLICCRCTCFTVIDSTLGTEEVREQMVSGVSISCDQQCLNVCEQFGWDIRAFAKVQCPDAEK